jgi:hypothetical protein
MSTRSHVVHCRPEELWDVLADGWLFTTWVVGAARIRDVDGDWPQPGAQIHHSVGLYPLMVDDSTRVEECEPPHRLRLTARAWPSGEAYVEIRVKPHPEGCEVWMDEQVTKGPTALVPKMVQDAVLRFRNDESLERLAMIAEGRSGSGSDRGSSSAG